MIPRIGSRACREIIRGSGISKYQGIKCHPFPPKIDVLVNYGLAGDRLSHFYKKYPSTRRIPTINKYVGKPKYDVVKEAEKAGIKVPESVLRLEKKSGEKEWIEKKMHSVGGIGIVMIKEGYKGYPRRNKYFQKFIKNRLYEIRVHAFKWTENWTVQKRLGDNDEIAWNHRNGGVFYTVRHPENFNIFKEAIEVSKKILDLRHMAFGAVDFLVDEDYNLYFIEINSAPGFQELSEDVYVSAFIDLKNMEKKDVLKFANRQ